MGWIVGVFGMIAAILVTSTIIPQMFEPGSITLLLSKPVSRSLLFTAKFLGACAFVFLNVTFLIVGLWLIAGLRFDIWNHGMLWCIPVFLFMFLIYYAVSAVTGLIWKSADHLGRGHRAVLDRLLRRRSDARRDAGAVLDQQRITRMVEADGTLAWPSPKPAAAGLGRGGHASGAHVRAARRAGHSHARRSVLSRAEQATGRRSGLSQSVRLRVQRISLRVAGEADGWKLRDGPSVPSGTAAARRCQRRHDFRRRRRTISFASTAIRRPRARRFEFSACGCR